MGSVPVAASGVQIGAGGAGDRLVVEDDAEEGAVDFKTVGIVDET